MTESLSTPVNSGDLPVLLDVKALDKTFAVPVLKNLSFQLRKGEIHALMGSNGAGKSTLCNIIAGIHQPTAGEMYFLGEKYTPNDVKAAEEAGIRMVMQELNLFPTLSIAENLCFKNLGNKFGIIDSKRLRERATKLLDLVGLDDVTPETPMEDLGVGKQQLIEIASVISEPIKLLIVDEPTAALTDPQIDLLFEQLRKLRDQGVGIIYISHRMDEIQRIADRVSVLRDGQLVATEDIKDIDVETIVNLMSGDLDSHSISIKPGIRPPKSCVLRVRTLSKVGAFEDINLDIYSGEVLGIGGLIGSGRTELLRTLFGADVADAGSLRFASDDFLFPRLMRSPEEGVANGIGLVVEDRKSQGLLLQKSLLRNISLSILPQLTNKFAVVDKQREHDIAVEIAQRLAIKFDNIRAPIASLSGGNQQKALIARWLLRDLPILLFDEPSRGVDARAKTRIHELIREQALKGKAVIVVSSETQELMTVSDRIIVLSNGRMAGEFDRASFSEEKLLEASFRFYNKSSPQHKTNDEEQQDVSPTH
ncbi:sugar ABC transporter ATP-binding protein [Sessilibacter sp. MAH1]